MNPEFAAWLADGMLALHAGMALFVVGLLPLVLIGGVRGLAWVRRFGLRITQVPLMVFIADQAWLGQLCPPPPETISPTSPQPCAVNS
jgi:hypothetical protein